MADASPHPPGPAVPARRHLGRRRRQLRPLQRARHRGRRSASSTSAIPAREVRRIPLERAHRPGLARLPARGAPRRSSTATACTAPTSRPPGHRFNPAKLAARSLREGDRGHASSGATPLFGYRIGDPEGDAAPDERDSAPYRAQERGGRPGVRLGRRPAAAHAAGTRPSSTRSTSRASPRAIPRCRRSCAAPTRASPRRRRCEHLTELGVTAVELLPVHHSVDRASTWSTAGSPTTGATTRSASSRPTRATPSTGDARRAGRRVQDDGEDAAPGGHRGHPRRGLQPHRRGQPPGADALLPRHRQRRLLPPRARQTRATTWTTPAAATRSTCGTRARSSSSWTACATGCWRCTWTASASTWPPRWPASCTTWTGSPPSSTSSTRTR